MIVSRDRDGLHWRFMGMSYVRVGRVVSFDWGHLRYRRIGSMWRLGWKWP